MSACSAWPAALAQSPALNNIQPGPLNEGWSTTASRYEPRVNRTYQDLAAHYGTTIVPTRPRRDEAKVESAVLIVDCEIFLGTINT